MYNCKCIMCNSQFRIFDIVHIIGTIGLGTTTGGRPCSESFHLYCKPSFYFRVLSCNNQYINALTSIQNNICYF